MVWQAMANYVSTYPDKTSNQVSLHLRHLNSLFSRFTFRGGGFLWF